MVVARLDEVLVLLRPVVVVLVPKLVELLKFLLDDCPQTRHVVVVLDARPRREKDVVVLLLEVVTGPRVAERWGPRRLVCKPPLLDHRGGVRRFFLS
eukprot:1021458-Rhodomonas_salina.1